MACKCSEMITVLKCKNDGAIQTISHASDENPLAEAAKQGRKCKKCYLSDFEVLKTSKK